MSFCLVQSCNFSVYPSLVEICGVIQYLIYKYLQRNPWNSWPAKILISCSWSSAADLGLHATWQIYGYDQSAVTGKCQISAGLLIPSPGATEDCRASIEFLPLPIKGGGSWRRRGAFSYKSMFNVCFTFYRPSQNLVVIQHFII